MMKKATAAAHQSELGATQAASAGSMDMNRLVQTAAAQAEKGEEQKLDELKAAKRKEDRKRAEQLDKTMKDIDEKKRMLEAEVKNDLEDGLAAQNRMKKA